MSQQRKVLFLDIDGVLNSYRNVLAYGRMPWPNDDSEKELDPIAIGMIRKICDEFQVEIIMHSTWRTSISAVEWGKKWNLPITGATEHGSKPHSIKIWLMGNPEVKMYAVIDDEDMHVGEHQVRTNMGDGMLHEHFEQLRDIFMSAEQRKEEEDFKNDLRKFPIV